LEFEQARLSLGLLAQFCFKASAPLLPITSKATPNEIRIVPRILITFFAAQIRDLSFI
jgi:hypothetical protein